MFGYEPGQLRKVTPVRKSSDNLRAFEDSHHETNQPENFRFKTEGSAFRRIGSPESSSRGGPFQHGVPFPTPLTKGAAQQHQKSDLDDSPFAQIGNFEHLTESPNFFRGQGPQSPDIMGLVSQLVHSSLPPDRFVDEFGKHTESRSIGIGTVSSSLDFESSHHHDSYEYLYSGDNNRQQSSSLSSQQLQMGYNRYNGESGTFQTEGNTTHYQPEFDQGNISFEPEPGGLRLSTSAGGSFPSFALISPKFSMEPQILSSSLGSASQQQQQQQQHLGLVVPSQSTSHNQSSGSLSVSTSTGSWASPLPSPQGQQQQQQQQLQLGGPWMHNNNGGGGPIEGGGGMGGSQFPSQSRPPPALYPAPPPLLPSRPYPNGNNSLGTGYHSEPTLTEILAEARRKQAQAALHGTSITIDTGDRLLGPYPHPLVLPSQIHF